MNPEYGSPVASSSTLFSMETKKELVKKKMSVLTNASYPSSLEWALLSENVVEGRDVIDT